MTTWNDIETLNWDQIERLNWAEIEAFVAEAHPILTQLTAAEREELREAVVAGAFPPPLLAGGDARHSRAEQAALAISSKASHISPGTAISAAALLIALLNWLGISPADDKPPAVNVIVNQLPAEHRPSPPEPPAAGPPSGVNPKGPTSP